MTKTTVAKFGLLAGGLVFAGGLMFVEDAGRRSTECRTGWCLGRVRSGHLQCGAWGLILQERRAWSSHEVDDLLQRQKLELRTPGWTSNLTQSQHQARSHS